MTFADLHEYLRLELLRRIASGALTGTRLAQQTGFRQAHISNFLNRKRALSLEGLDRVLQAQRLTIDQILPLDPAPHLSAGSQPPAPLSFAGDLPINVSQHQQTSRKAQTQSQAKFQTPSQARLQAQAQAKFQDKSQSQSEPLSLAAASAPTPQDLLGADPVYAVPLVSPSVAMNHPRIAPAAVLQSLPLSPTLLLEHNPRIHSLRQLWQRFVAIRVDAQQASAMSPLLATGAAAVLDRHATSPVSAARSSEPALFAVRSGASLLLRLIELDDDHLILRPISSSTPVQLIPVSQETPPADFLVGRVVLLLTSL